MAAIELQPTLPVPPLSQLATGRPIRARLARVARHLAVPCGIKCSAMIFGVYMCRVGGGWVQRCQVLGHPSASRVLVVIVWVSQVQRDPSRPGARALGKIVFSVAGLELRIFFWLLGRKLIILLCYR